MIERVRSRGDVFVVEREGQPICRITPMDAPRSTIRDFVHLVRSAPPPDEEYFEIVEQLSRAQPGVPETPWG